MKSNIIIDGLYTLMDVIISEDLIYNSNTIETILGIKHIKDRFKDYHKVDNMLSEIGVYDLLNNDALKLNLLEKERGTILTLGTESKTVIPIPFPITGIERERNTEHDDRLIFNTEFCDLYFYKRRRLI